MEIGLETNYVIDLLNGSIDYKSFQSRFQHISIPATVLGELFFGAEKSSRKDENYSKIIAFAADCNLIPSDEAVARQYAVCRKKLFNNGTPVPENDIWIAAACIVKNIPIATRDSHFDKIEGLSVIAS
jgi:tRNA(fMet)-specific endonuclease VapC